MRPEPDTDCEVCWWAEASAPRRLLARLLPERSPIGIDGMVNTIRAAIGVKVRTWEERHRADWEATGDAVHLARLLRHVDIP